MISIPSKRSPEKSEFQALRLHDHKQDEFTMTGYVRTTWNECKISSYLFPPNYLLKIMQGYYMNEYVHLFAKVTDGWFDYDRKCKHWKMNLFDIISELK